MYSNGSGLANPRLQPTGEDQAYMSHWFAELPEEVQYASLLFALFVFPRALQRFRLPSAITSVGLGAAAGMGLGLFRNDPTITLLSTLGIVSLFLFAGLEVDFRGLQQNGRTLLQHLAIRVILLVVVTLFVRNGFALPLQSATLMALALTTPSTGFILDSLPSLGVSDEERGWIKSKAIATELLALLVLFLALQPASVERILLAILALAAAVAALPILFRLFASWVLPYAPKSEFAFLLMVAVLTAYVTRSLGAYYLVGAFVVGLTAQQFRERMPAMASERMVHAVEVFASFFVPFYFFHAGLQFQRQDFTPIATALGLGFVAAFVPFRVLLVALHRGLSLGEPLSHGARIGIAISPTLVFTLVIAEILRQRYALSDTLFGALIVYTLVTTLLPAFILRVPPPDLEDLRAPPAGPTG
ncbi:MAG TPA: cation:proton antiporter [Gemmatimonadales bacterium]